MISSVLLTSKRLKIKSKLDLKNKEYNSIYIYIYSIIRALS